MIQITNASGSLVQQVTTAGDGAQNVQFNAFGITLELSASYTQAAGVTGGDIVVTGSSTDFMVSVSGDPTGNDLVSLTALNLSLTSLGGGATGLSAESLASKAGSQAAILKLDIAIQDIAGEFGTVGAAQNRIEIAMANADTAIENFSAAESVIRDVDVATESTEFARLSIQQQATTAMLAQANAAPQLVLQLLG